MTTKKPTIAKKPAAKKAAKPEKAAHVHETTGAYTYAVGRRKSGIAQVRVYATGKGAITVNRKPMKEYFPVEELQDIVLVPLKAVGMDATADVVAEARGGGIRGQADAVKLGIARALLKHNPDFRATLKPLGALTRDPREKERKKYGLKEARKSPLWAKR
jgi:small subunit ribosomal protein S9